MLTFLKDRPKVDLCMDCLKDKDFVERFLLESRIYKADNLSTQSKMLSIEHPAETLENTLALIDSLLKEIGSEESLNYNDCLVLKPWIESSKDWDDRHPFKNICQSYVDDYWIFEKGSLVIQTPLVLSAALIYIRKWERDSVLTKTFSNALKIYGDNLKQKVLLWYHEAELYHYYGIEEPGVIGNEYYSPLSDFAKLSANEQKQWLDDLPKSELWKFLPTKDLIKELGFDVKPTLNSAVVELFKKDKAKYYKFGEENKPKKPSKLKVRVLNSDINKIAGEDPTAEHLQEVLKDALAQHAKRKGLSIKDVNFIPPKVTGAATVSVEAPKTVEGKAATKIDPRIDVLANHLNSIDKQPGVGVGDVATFISGRDRQIKGRDASGNNIYRNADTEVLWKAIARYFEDEIPIPVGRIVRGKNRGKEQRLIQVHPKCQEFIELWPKGALKECRWEKPPEKKGRWSGQTYKIFHGNTGNRADPQRLAAWLVQNMDIDMYVRTWESRKAA